MYLSSNLEILRMILSIQWKLDLLQVEKKTLVGDNVALIFIYNVIHRKNAGTSKSTIKLRRTNTF